MRNILIFDRYMVGKESTTYGLSVPKKFKWAHADAQFGTSQHIETVNQDIVVYTENSINLPDKIGKIKIALMLEPEEYIPDIYQWLREHYDEFDYVFTWNKELLGLHPKFIFLNPGNSWINEREIAIYPKTKLASMVASEKRFLSGHCFRRHIFEKYQASFDRFGPDTKYVNNLIDAYKDYRFTIVVENARQDYMFTEKLVSPILCGTIPIYYGCPSLGQFFNMDGILAFTNLTRFEQILGSLSQELYESMLPAAADNFTRAQRYQLLENNFFDKLVEMKLT